MNTEDKEEAKLIENKVPANRDWNDDDDDYDDEDDEKEIGIQPAYVPKTTQYQGAQPQRSPKGDQQRKISLDDESEFIITKKDSPDKLQQNSAAYGGNQRQYNNRNQNEEGGQRGDFKKPFTKKFDPSQIDLQSNYRLYYEKDFQFYSDVIESEDPGEYGYQFKIMLNLTPEMAELSTDQTEIEMFQVLSDYGGVDIRITSLLPQAAKIKCLFKLKDQQTAKKVYQDICNKPYIFGAGMKALIYLQMSEEIFVKHGDIQAKLYYEDQQKQKSQQQRPQHDYNQRQGGGIQKYNSNRQDYSYQQDGYGGGYNNGGYQKGQGQRSGNPKYDQHHGRQHQNLRDLINEEDTTPIQFKGKPQFVNTRSSQEGDDHRTVTVAKRDTEHQSQQQQQQQNQVRTVIQQDQRKGYYGGKTSAQYDQNEQSDRKISFNENRGGNYGRGQRQNYQGQGEDLYNQDIGLYQTRSNEVGGFSRVILGQTQMLQGRGKNYGNKRTRQNYNDTISNQDNFETTSQISETLSRHSSKTEGQYVKKGSNHLQPKRSNEEKQGAHGYSNNQKQQPRYNDDLDGQYYQNKRGGRGGFNESRQQNDRQQPQGYQGGNRGGRPQQNQQPERPQNSGQARGSTKKSFGQNRFTNLADEY